MNPDKPVNVLYCETNVDGTVGGSYYSLLYLVKGLDRKRFRPIVVFYADHALLDAFREAGAEVLVWPRGKAFAFATRQNGPFRWLDWPALLVQRTLNLLFGHVASTVSRVRFLRAHDIRLVHLNNSIKYNHDWMAAAMLMGRKCICHERGINEEYSAASKYFGKRLDGIISISQAVEENLRRRGVGFPNIVTIHNGLDPSVMIVRTPPDQLRRAYHFDQADPLMVMVGNIRPWKGQEILVRAMDRVHRACPAVRCLIVGDTSPNDRDYERSLRQLVVALGLEEHVVFAGFQRNVTDFLTMSDVLVHASIQPEPFGRVILEAMACRKPVIGSRDGAVTELVRDGETGLTFSPGDSIGLAAAILKLASDRDEARRLGAHGYQRLTREFHIDKNVESTQRLYQSLLHRTN